MKMGVEYVSNYLTMAAATIHFLSQTMLCILGPMITILLLFTRFWYIIVLYLIWIWVIDKKVHKEGGRACNWICRLKLFEYAKDYYPVTFHTVPGFKVDATENYMCCSFPHGIMPLGTSLALSTKSCGVDKIIPNHSIHPLTLDFNFKVPIFRDYILALGLCSVSADSINWMLNHPNGGKIALIVVGGAAEAALSTPGVYNLFLKNRKGFAKLALKNGSSIIPLFSFGEVDTFEQVKFKEGSLLHRIQNWVKNKTGVSALLVSGRRYYQNIIGFVPFKTPINVIMGKPIKVDKIMNPTQEDIDNLHTIFITNLNNIFEEYKYKYIKNPDTTNLIVV